MKARKIDPIFREPRLTAEGMLVANRIEREFDGFLRTLEGLIPLGGREGAIVRRSLAEACIYSKRALRGSKRFQEGE